MTNSRRLLLAAASYVILTFIIAATWHLVAFKAVYEQLAIYTRSEPIIPLGIASMIVQAVIFALLYPRFARGVSPAREGALFGLVMGAFLASYAVLADAAKLEVTSLGTWLALEGIYYLIQFPLVGLVFGLIYGRSSKAG